MIYRRFPTSSIWNEMEQFQREMDRMFGAFTPGSFEIAPSFPVINAYSNDHNEVITAEMPGMRPEDIQLNIVGQTLTLSGSRQPDTLEKNAEYHRQERMFGKFTRTFELLFPVEADKVEANFKDGILRIVLPRAEADRPKKIAVKTA
jgi:HSP20 family protein